jgi:hypothetical protein
MSNTFICRSEMNMMMIIRDKSVTSITALGVTKNKKKNMIDERSKRKEEFLAKYLNYKSIDIKRYCSSAIYQLEIIKRETHRDT